MDPGGAVECTSAAWLDRCQAAFALQVLDNGRFTGVTFVY